MDCAFNNGITLLDTASAYGNSEEIIGDYIKKTGNEFRIMTKLSNINNDISLSDFINNQIESSLSKLSKNVIDFYLIHNFNDLIYYKELISLLLDLKREGKIKKIGVSLYEPSELEYLILNHVNEIDFVQIPFNILDSRWLSNNLLFKVKKLGINIFVRSIFLQGLIFLEDESKMDKIDKSLKKYIKFINNLLTDKKISMSRLAIDYVASYEVIDGILIGCETVDQLKENINQFSEENVISDLDKENILKITQNIPNKIIDPRKW